MLWRGRRQSVNVIDQRAVGATGLGLGGLVMGAFVYYLMGGNPLVYVMQNIDTATPPSQVEQQHQNEYKEFAAVVLADTEDVWGAQFRGLSRGYEAPKLVLFNGRVESACGMASSATGPFYCPLDRRVYLDLSFMDDLSNRLGAEGDFAGAYVIAHEVGHHIQNLLGIERESREYQRAHPTERNRASVQVELQADCLAGVWARQTERAKNVVEQGDIDEAMRAAAAVGDDRLQKQAQGYVVPDSFTHGSSAQRVSAFRHGYRGGELRSCLQ